MTILRSGSATHVGRVRQINQDLALESPNLFAVADGMGGHAGGEVAARVAVEALQAAFARQPSTEGLEQAVLQANQAVFQQSLADVDLRGMGTTLTVAALVAGADGRDLVALANVGDSRAYLYSAGELVQITEDHSLAEERVRRGELSEAEAATDPRRHILTRALGVAPDVDVDLWELHLHSGDRVVLCSDGLTNEVEGAEIAEVLESVTDPSEAARALVDSANDHGGSDNITVVVVDVLLGEESGPRTSVDPVPTTAGAGPGTAGPPAAPGADPPGAGPTGDDVFIGGRPRGALLDETQALGMGAVMAPSADDTMAVGQVGAPAGGAAAPAPDAARAAAGPAGASAAGAATATLTRPAVPDATRSDTAVVAPPGAAGPTLARPAVRRETRRERRRRLGVPRRLTVRVVLFFVLLAGIVVATYYVVRWYAEDNWFVTLKGNELVVYRGQPGGVLWFEPKLVDRTGVARDQVPAIKVPVLQADVSWPSLAAARQYVRNLEQEYRDQKALANNPGGSGSVGPTGPIGPSGTLPPTVPTTTAPVFPAFPPSASTTTTAPTTASTTTPASTVPATAPTTATTVPPTVPSSTTTTAAAAAVQLRRAGGDR